MIKNDIRYIIKKILIGIGICIGLFYFKSCNVHALNDQWYTLRASLNMPSGQALSNGQILTYVIDGKSYIISNSNGSIYLNDRFVTSNTTNPGYVIGKDNNNNIVVYFAITQNGYQQNMYTINPTTGTPIFYGYPITINNLGGGAPTSLKFVYNNGNYVSSDYVNCPNHVYSHLNNQMYSCFYNENLDVYGTNALRMAYGSYNNISYKYYYSDYGSPEIIPPNNPEIVSLNAQLNKTDSDMLVSVSFSPEFSFIDTDNYNYYAWFEGEKKFLISENNVKFNTQQNTTFYVEITDKEGNTIDTETYSVTSIGLIYNGSYDIQFSTTELTNSDTTNDSDLVIDEINRIDIDITYIPKWVNYQYQYQWVNQNDSITNNWVTINIDSDKNNYTYVTRVNGTLHARILDSDNNVLKSSSYTITRIGELKTYDKNSGRIFNAFNNLNNQINFGGPISNLIVMPVNILETILQAGSSQCSPYYLGTIGGHPLTLTCVNPQDYLGSYLWTLIDIIVSGCLIYSIAKWLMSLYWNFVMLQNTPDINPETFGDRRDLL